MKKLIFVLMGIGCLLSCKDASSSTQNTSKQISIPNYANVDLEKVFPENQLTTNDIDSLQKVIQKYYAETWEFDNLWGGLLVAKGDQIIFENYRGFARENHHSPITQDTPLHIASASKTLTAMAVLKLVESGQIDLSSDVKKYFKDFPYAGITVKSLLTQRSGLTKYEYFTEGITPSKGNYFTNQEIYQLLVKHQPELVRAPNTGFMYNNLNFSLLALLIEKVTNVPYPVAMQKIVFEPLKMKNTFVFQEKNLKNMPLTFYQRNEKAHPLDRFDLIYGDKNIYTTPRDLFNFSIAMYSDDFLRKDLKDQIFQPYSNETAGVNNYGLGFRMKIFNENQKLTYHNGWWHGTNSVFVHQENTKVTIIAIGNKFSKRVYSAMKLSALFEPLPFEISDTEDGQKPLDSIQIKENDSIANSNAE